MLLRWVSDLCVRRCSVHSHQPRMWLGVRRPENECGYQINEFHCFRSDLKLFLRLWLQRRATHPELIKSFRCMCDAVRGTNTAAPHPNHRRANAHRSPCVRHLNFSFPFSGKKRSSRCMEHSLSVDYNSFSPSSVPFAPNDYVIALPACNTALLPAHRLSFGLLRAVPTWVSKKPSSPLESSPIPPRFVRTRPKNISDTIFELRIVRRAAVWGNERNERTWNFPERRRRRWLTLRPLNIHRVSPH